MEEYIRYSNQLLSGMRLGQLSKAEEQEVHLRSIDASSCMVASRGNTAHATMKTTESTDISNNIGVTLGIIRTFKFATCANHTKTS